MDHGVKIFLVAFAVFLLGLGLVFQSLCSINGSYCFQSDVNPLDYGWNFVQRAFRSQIYKVEPLLKKTPIDLSHRGLLFDQKIKVKYYCTFDFDYRLVFEEGNVSSFLYKMEDVQAPMRFVISRIPVDKDGREQIQEPFFDKKGVWPVYYHHSWTYVDFHIAKNVPMREGSYRIQLYLLDDKEDLAKHKAFFFSPPFVNPDCPFYYGFEPPRVDGMVGG